MRKSEFAAIFSPLAVSAGLAGFALGAVVFAGGWGASLLWLLPIVLCLGMHLFMHRGHGHHSNDGRSALQGDAGDAAEPDAAALRGGGARVGGFGREA